MSFDFDFEDDDEDSEEDFDEEEELDRSKRKRKPSKFEKVLYKYDLRESRLIFRMVRERARRERLRLHERSRIDYVS